MQYTDGANYNHCSSPKRDNTRWEKSDCAEKQKKNNEETNNYIYAARIVWAKLLLSDTFILHKCGPFVALLLLLCKQIVPTKLNSRKTENLYKEKHETTTTTTQRLNTRSHEEW